MNQHAAALVQTHLIAGAYTREDPSYGLYRLIREADGWHKTTEGLPALENCSWLESGTSSPRSEDRFILAAEENGDGKGRLARYSFTRGQLDRLDLGTDAPCHILQIDEWVLVSNYSPGLVSCVSLLDGGLQLVTELINSAPEDEGDAYSHAHQAVLSPDGQELAVANLGFDRVYLYDWPALKAELEDIRPGQQADETPQLKDRHKSELQLPQGEGPRHLVYSEDGLSLYILTELGTGLWHYVRSDDAWKPRERFSLGEIGTDQPSGLVLSPDQSLLAAGVRGSNTVVTFVRNRRTGYLNPQQVTDCGGDWPRSLYWLDNETLLVCNERSGDLQIFDRDGQNLDSKAEFLDLPGVAIVIAWDPPLT